MTRQELLHNYREIAISIDLMERQIEKMSGKYFGGPRPVKSPQLTGMPRGTNDPEAAMLQTISFEDGLLDQIRKKQEEQREMMYDAEKIIESITDFQLQNIVRSYYILGWTDERIAENESLARQTVQKKRSDFFDGLA